MEDCIILQLEILIFKMEEMRKIALMVSLIIAQCVDKKLMITLNVKDDDAFADFIGIKTKYMDANFVMLEAKSESVTKCAFWKIETEDVEDYEIDETIRDIEVKLRQQIITFS